MTLSLLVSQISLILIYAPMVVGKLTKNLTTLSLLKAKIPAEAEFMQTSLNYVGSCNILLYATMNNILTKMFFHPSVLVKGYWGIYKKLAIKYIYLPPTSCRIWFTPAEVYVRSCFFSGKSRLKSLLNININFTENWL